MIRCPGSANCEAVVTTAATTTHTDCISSSSECINADLSTVKSTSDETSADSSNIEGQDNVMSDLDSKISNSASVLKNADSPDNVTSAESEGDVKQPVDHVTDTALMENVLRESIVQTLHRFIPLALCRYSIFYVLVKLVPNLVISAQTCGS